MLRRFAEGAYVPVSSGRTAPVVDAHVSVAEGNKTTATVSLMIDSGSDVTVLPESVVGVLGLKAVDRLDLFAFDHDRASSYNVVEVALKIGLIRLRAVRICVAPGPYGLLGRDLLDRVTLELHGPQQRWVLLR